MKKKLLACVLAVLVVFCFAGGALAADSTQSMTISATLAPEYVVYIPQTLDLGVLDADDFAVPEVWADGDSVSRTEFSIEARNVNLAANQFIEVLTVKDVYLENAAGDILPVEVYPYERAFTKNETKVGNVTVHKEDTAGLAGDFAGTTDFDISLVTYDIDSEIQRSVGTWSWEWNTDKVVWDIETGQTYKDLYPGSSFMNSGVTSQEDAIALLEKVRDEFGYTGVTSVLGYSYDVTDERFSVDNLLATGMGMGETYGGNGLSGARWHDTAADAITVDGQAMSIVEYLKVVDEYMTDSNSKGTIGLPCLTSPIFVDVTTVDGEKAYDGVKLSTLNSDIDAYAKVFEDRVDRIVKLNVDINEAGGLDHFCTMEVEPGKVAFESPLEVAVLMDRVEQELKAIDETYVEYVQLALDLGHLARCEASEAGESNTTEAMGFDYFMQEGYIPEDAAYINGFYSEFRDNVNGHFYDEGDFSIEKYMAYPGVSGNIKEIQFWDWDGGTGNNHWGFGLGKTDYMQWMKALVDQGAFDGTNITAEFYGNATYDAIKDGGMFTKEWVLLYFVDRI